MNSDSFNELKESLNQTIEHAKGERDDLRTTVCFDNAHFVLNSEQLRSFNEKLAAPPPSIPALRKLLNDEDVFNGK